jgi:hypothetical protein
MNKWLHSSWQLQRYVPKQQQGDERIAARSLSHGTSFFQIVRDLRFFFLVFWIFIWMMGE